MKERKNFARRGRKLLTGAAVLLLTFCFSLTAFSQPDAPRQSRVERSGDEVQIVYTFALPGTEDPSRIDGGLVEQTRKTVLREKNSWPQSHPVENVGAAEQLLGVDLLLEEPDTGYEAVPDRSDTLRVAATATGEIAGTTYTGYRTYGGYGVTMVAETNWDTGVSPYKEYRFPFDGKKYTVEEIPLTMPSGGTVTAYEVLDEAGALAGQYAMFEQDATAYLLYLIPFGQEKAPANGGTAIQTVLRDWVPAR